MATFDVGGGRRWFRSHLRHHVHFGGLRADSEGRVLDAAGAPLPGLLVCGEMLGGLFSGNYPGGSGLTAGAVFGRRAGGVA